MSNIVFIRTVSLEVGQQHFKKFNFYPDLRIRNSDTQQYLTHSVCVSRVRGCDKKCDVAMSVVTWYVHTTARDPAQHVQLYTGVGNMYINMNMLTNKIQILTVEPG